MHREAGSYKTCKGFALLWMQMHMHNDVTSCKLLLTDNKVAAYSCNHTFVNVMKSVQLPSCMYRPWYWYIIRSQACHSHTTSHSFHGQSVQ